MHLRDVIIDIGSMCTGYQIMGVRYLILRGLGYGVIEGDGVGV